jgi:hypothetical protein
MSGLVRHGGWVGSLALGIALGAVSCGSDDNKLRSEREDTAGEAGQAGAPNAGASGSSGGSESGGGEAGTPSVPVAGAGGEAGMPGGNGGAAGEAPVAACTPAGAVDGASFDSEPTYSVCRGARQYIDFTAAGSDPDFTCCGISSAAPPYPLQVSGVNTNADGGFFTFLVPEDAPLGSQFVTVNCSSGELSGAIALNVSDSAPPIVTAVPDQVPWGDPLVITGTNLAGVSVRLQGAGDVPYECLADTEQSDDTTITCSFGDFVPAGAYSVLVARGDCGFAATAPSFELLPPDA